jgi:hypothetical protein
MAVRSRNRSSVAPGGQEREAYDSSPSSAEVNYVELCLNCPNTFVAFNGAPFYQRPSFAFDTEITVVSVVL